MCSVHEREKYTKNVKILSLTRKRQCIHGKLVDYSIIRSLHEQEQNGRWEKNTNISPQNEVNARGASEEVSAPTASMRLQVRGTLPERKMDSIKANA